jgi:hypothetical protein
MAQINVISTNTTGRMPAESPKNFSTINKTAANGASASARYHLERKTLTGGQARGDRKIVKGCGRWFCFLIIGQSTSPSFFSDWHNHSLIVIPKE